MKRFRAGSYRNQESKKQTQGFTQVELLITLCIAAILLQLAVPPLTRWIEKTRVQAETTELLESFTLARHYAVKAQTYVTVCGSSRGDACDGGWHTGFLVFVNNDDGNEFINRALTPVLYHYKTNDTFTTRGNIRRFTFRPSGLLKGNAGSLLFCPKSSEIRDYRRIVVSRGGRIRAYTAEQVAQKRYLSDMTCTG